MEGVWREDSILPSRGIIGYSEEYLYAKTNLSTKEAKAIARARVAQTDEDDLGKKGLASSPRKGASKTFCLNGQPHPPSFP